MEHVDWAGIEQHRPDSIDYTLDTEWAARMNARPTNTSP